MDLKELAGLNNMIVNMVIEADTDDQINCAFDYLSASSLSSVHVIISDPDCIEDDADLTITRHDNEGEAHRKIYVLDHYLKGSIGFGELQKELGK